LLVSAQPESSEFDGGREEKLARNQALFREINERIRSLSAEFASSRERQLDLICECSDDRCANPIKVGIEDYERVRASARRFLVFPRHDIPQIERIVDRGNGYEVVEKFGDAGRVVADDPLRHDNRDDERQ
jgi:hypothetical protein